ncbi:hypothetical protein SYNPS1DRAFT_21489, partial [Syncephalis pseudoplumigaleata]
KDTVVHIRGPWLLLDRSQGVQGGSTPLLCHLPSGCLLVETQRKAGVSQRIIQTFSDSLVCSPMEYANRSGKHDAPPSAVLFSVFVHRETGEADDGSTLAKDYLHWELTKYTLPTDPTDASQGVAIAVCNSGRLTDHRINSKSVWLERVDHQRVLVRFRRLGPTTPQIMLVRSTNIASTDADLPTNTSVIWQAAMDPEAMHAYAGRNMALVLLSSNELLVLSLDKGERLYATDCFRQSYGEACLGARVLRIQPASRHDSSSSESRRGRLEIVRLDAHDRELQPLALSVQPPEARSMDMAKSLGELFRPVKLQFAQLR